MKVEIKCIYKDQECVCQIEFKKKNEIFEKYKKICPKVRFGNVKIKQIIKEIK